MVDKATARGLGGVGSAWRDRCSVRGKGFRFRPKQVAFPSFHESGVNQAERSSYRGSVDGVLYGYGHLPTLIMAVFDGSTSAPTLTFRVRWNGVSCWLLGGLEIISTSRRQVSPRFLAVALRWGSGLATCPDGASGMLG